MENSLEPNKCNPIMVAMSGGVDSAVAAALLQREGHEIAGVTLRMFDPSILPKGVSSPFSTDAPVTDAKQAADRLGIPHYVLDASEEFQRDVITPFVTTYCEGGTPNPCVDCNRCVKFGSLFDSAEQLGYHILATGHYSAVETTGSGRILLRRAADPSKDQTYMLWSLTQDKLARVRFPLGGMKKSEVKDIAEELGLVSAKRKESQDICFIPDGDYAAFIHRFLGKTFPEGNFISPDGKVLGRHKGIIHYTIGQRKGLGIALGKPAYVLKLNPVKNTVMLGDAHQLLTRHMLVEQLSPVDADRFFAEEQLSVRIRYRSRAIPCSVVCDTGDGRTLIRFHEEVSAVTPGQSAVFYVGSRLVGGAFIASQRGIGQWVD